MNRRGRRRLWLVASLALLPAPAPAQSPPASARWEVDWSNRTCSLVRRSAANELMLVLRGTPGNGRWSLLILSSRLQRSISGDRGPITIRLLPSAAALDGTIHGMTDLGQGIGVYGVPRDVVDQFASADTVSVFAGDQALFELPIGSPQRAVQTLRQCESDALRRWNVDPAAWRALRSPPEIIPVQVVQYSDYPASAIRANQQGDVTVRLVIGLDGRVSECVIVESSGHDILDRTTCPLVTERLEATPAVGANGAPVAAPYVSTIRWVLPQRRG